MVRRLTPLLWHVARAQGLDRESSSDVVQTTWLLLLGGLSGIRTPKALVSWLVTVVKRESWKVRRAQRAERLADDLPDEADPGPGPEDEAVTAARDRELWRAVRSLPEHCRRLLRVVAFTHRPDYGQVAAALGMRRGSVGPQRGRCLAQLAKLLHQPPDEAGGAR
ncbi:RNA polymerase sigma factor [Saccharothrix variisporea]|uniref:RNA polymerase sigma factor n=1 Tax=Saccharothrix variisporea TaxID=543527 RepID=UPI001FE2BF18|nr:sigma-70 family RNA polymerase sigma factor [Saccharothrix variisporea]